MSASPTSTRAAFDATLAGPHRARRRTLRGWAVPAVAVLLVSGCAAGGAEPVDRGVEPTMRSFTAESRVIQPGSPGEPAEVLEPGESGTIPDGGYTEAEVRFMEDMIPHHAQALRMARIAQEKSDNEQVQLVAGAIIAAQEPEISAMQGWLEGHGLPAPDPEDTAGSHDHADMPGMATDFQVQALQESTGADFDERFLTLMMRHHEGAVTMAEPVVEHAVDLYALEIAGDVSVGQSIEINRLREILDSL